MTVFLRDAWRALASAAAVAAVAVLAASNWLRWFRYGFLIGQALFV